MIRALRAEFGKLKRSRVPALTALTVALWPLWGLFVVRLASGSLSSVTWNDFMAMGPQDIASWWGFLLGGLIAAYIFGREYGEATIQNSLTLPIRREWFVAAKVVVLLAWLFALAVLSITARAAFAVLLRLDGFEWHFVVESFKGALMVTLVIAATLPVVAWIAVLGRGFLAPMLFSGVAFASGVLFLQGDSERWVPWAMPIALAGMSWVPGETKSSLVAGSWLVLAAVFVAGVAALVIQTDFADCLE